MDAAATAWKPSPSSRTGRRMRRGCAGSAGLGGRSLRLVGVVFGWLAVSLVSGSGCQSIGSIWGGRNEPPPTESGGLFSGERLGLLTPASRSSEAVEQVRQAFQADLASAQREVAVLSEESRTLRETLASTVARLRKAEADRTVLAATVASGTAASAAPASEGVGRLASSARPLGATLTPNDGIRERASQIVIEGVTARADGDLIRLTLPGDLIFAIGETKLQVAAAPMLDTVGATIRRDFPRQIIGIEAHLDKDTTGASSVVRHQITAEQALAVLNYFVQRSQLSERQFFLLAQGDNKPVASNATLPGRARNRRIEIVIYPETY